MRIVSEHRAAFCASVRKTAESSGHHVQARGACDARKEFAVASHAWRATAARSARHGGAIAAANMRCM